MPAVTARKRGRRSPHERVVVGANTGLKISALGIGLVAMLAVLQVLI